MDAARIVRGLTEGDLSVGASLSCPASTSPPTPLPRFAGSGTPDHHDGERGKSQDRNGRSPGDPRGDQRVPGTGQPARRRTIRPTVDEYLHTDIAPLLRQSRCTEDLRRHLFSGAAELTQLAGWQAYDLEMQGLAQRYLVQALTMARFAGDKGLGGEILAAMSHQAAYVVQPEQAIEWRWPHDWPGGAPGCPPWKPKASSWKPTAMRCGKSCILLPGPPTCRDGFQPDHRTGTSRDGSVTSTRPTSRPRSPTASTPSDRAGNREVRPPLTRHEPSLHTAARPSTPRYFPPDTPCRDTSTKHALTDGRQSTSREPGLPRATT